jgi:hypothetical protein
VDRPLLLCSGRKFVLRLYLLVASLSPPHAFVSSSGWYARVAGPPYAHAPHGDAAAHLLVAAKYQGSDTGGGHGRVAGAREGAERVLCASEAVLALAAAHPHLEHRWPEVWARIKAVLAHVVRLLVNRGAPSLAGTGGGGTGQHGGGVGGSGGVVRRSCGGGEPSSVPHLSSGGCRAAYGVDLLLVEDEWWQLQAPPSRAPQSAPSGSAARSSDENQTVPEAPLVSNPPSFAAAESGAAEAFELCEPPPSPDALPCEPPLPQPVLLEVNYSPDYGTMLELEPSFLNGMMERLFLVPLAEDGLVGGAGGGRGMGGMRVRETEQSDEARAGSGHGGGDCPGMGEASSGSSAVGGRMRAGAEERSLPASQGGDCSSSCAHWERLHL